MSATNPKPIPPIVRERLGKLMPMLSSSISGERDATLNAITRTLDTYELDWHDVTALLITKPPVAAAKPRPGPKRGERAMTAPEVAELAIAVRDSGRVLDERVSKFLSDTLDHAQRYYEVFFNEQEWAWVQDLARKAGMR